MANHTVKLTVDPPVTGEALKLAMIELVEGRYSEWHVAFGLGDVGMAERALLLDFCYFLLHPDSKPPNK